MSKGTILDKLERLEQAAEPGPWVLEWKSDGMQSDGQECGYGCLPRHWDPDRVEVREMVMADIRFVEVMRVAAPGLIREIRRLQGENTRMIAVINIMKELADKLDQVDPEEKVMPGIPTTRELADFIRKIAGGLA